MLTRVTAGTDVGAGDAPAHGLGGARLLLQWLPQVLCGLQLRLNGVLRLCCGALSNMLLLLIRGLEPGLLQRLPLLLWLWLPLLLLLQGASVLLLLLLGGTGLARTVLQLMRLQRAARLGAASLCLLLRGAGVASRRVEGVVGRRSDR